MDAELRNDSLRPPLVMKLLLLRPEVAVDDDVDGAAVDGFLAEYAVLSTDLELGILSDRVSLPEEDSCLEVPSLALSSSFTDLVASKVFSSLEWRLALVRRLLLLYLPGSLPTLGIVMTSSLLDLSWMRFLIRSKADSALSDNISFFSLRPYDPLLDLE